MTDFISIYEKISEEEYNAAVDPTFSYFPVELVTGEKDENGKPIVDVSYAKHKYIYGKEMKDYLMAGGV